MQIVRNKWFGWMLVIGLMIVSILLLQTGAAAKSKPKSKVTTITITKVNQKTAKKVHNQLMRGKKFKLRVKGNMKTFHKKTEKLMDKVASRTEYRFDFYPIILNEASVRTAQSYTYCTLSSQDCKEYIYGLKFAEQRYKFFMDYVDQAISELGDIRNQVISDNQDLHIRLYIGLNTSVSISGENMNVPTGDIPTKLDEIIASLQELSEYLHKTKFYQLSEAMKARIMLTIGGGRRWRKSAMHYKIGDSCTTFKALYSNKAYGKCHHFALTTCKICAVFNIGECDYFFSVAEDHAVARAKVKTLSGKTKYSAISNGDLHNYNDYAGYDSSPVSYSHLRKTGKKLKKIDTETQELKMPYLRIIMRSVSTGTTITPKGGAIYCYVPRSEW